LTERSAAARRGPGAGIRSARPWSRAELLLIAALLTLSAAAWFLVHRLASPDMRLGILTTPRSGDMMGSMPMARSMSVGLFLVTWMVMMAAMMLPSVTPVVVRVNRMVRARAGREAAPYAMAAGYLLVWSLAGMAAYGVFMAFQSIAANNNTLAVRAGALVLLLAGIYQLSPLKRVCLRRCRSPLALVVRYAQTIVRGRAGALRVGLGHGTYCLGCCWAFMVILLAAGMMSLVWMGAIAAIVLAEKLHPRGEAFSKLLGALFILLALVVAAAPGALPALT
jgi:predicted metal-binding membrane protein